MTWELLIPLIARYGPAWVKEFVHIVKNHPEPTDEAFDKLTVLATKPLAQYIEEARQRAQGPG